MKYNISVDVEATGPTPVLFSMIQVGAVVVEDHSKTFFADLKPRDGMYHQPAALNAINLTINTVNDYPPWQDGVVAFWEWLMALKDGNRHHVVFWSDNPGFDWQFVNAYFHLTGLQNPFGFSSRRIGDLYAGLVGNPASHTKWKKYRKTKHTHNALDDAMGNAQALEQIFNVSWNA